jgi:hypothetical protein
LRPAAFPDAMADRDPVPAIAASTCRHVHRLIAERFDRALSEDEEKQVDLHMSTCHDCLVFYGQLTLIHKAFEALRQGAEGSASGERPNGRR